MIDAGVDDRPRRTRIVRPTHLRPGPACLEPRSDPAFQSPIRPEAFICRRCIRLAGRALDGVRSRLVGLERRGFRPCSTGIGGSGRIAAVQFRPSLLDRVETTRGGREIHAAADADSELVVFPEACLPGYPAWLSSTGGWSSMRCARGHPCAVRRSGGGDASWSLESVCAAAAVRGIEVVLGGVERGLDRGGHSLYCTAFWIDTDGHLVNVHRKLVPTYEERLCWSPGDGHGLRTRKVGEFRVGALNCWENWMPLARASLQAEGLDVHLMLWPGAPANTEELTRVAAREGRCYVVSVCGVLNALDLPEDLPELATMRQETDATGEPRVIHRGGSCVAGPDGEWVVSPDTASDSLETMLLVDVERLESRRTSELRCGRALLQTGHPEAHGRSTKAERRIVRRRRDAEHDRRGSPGRAIEHLVLTVRDPDHAVRFYRRVLGFDEVRQANEVRALQFGSQRLELRTDEDDEMLAGSRPTWGSTDLCLVSRAPLEDWIEHLRRFGIPIVLGPVDRPGTTAPAIHPLPRSGRQSGGDRESSPRPGCPTTAIRLTIDARGRGTPLSCLHDEPAHHQRSSSPIGQGQQEDDHHRGGPDAARPAGLRDVPRRGVAAGRRGRADARGGGVSSPIVRPSRGLADG